MQWKGPSPNLVFLASGHFRTGGTFEKWYSSPGIKKIYATPNKYIEDGFYVVATVNGIKYLVLFECKEEYLVNLVNFTGKTVIEKDYK